MKVFSTFIFFSLISLTTVAQVPVIKAIVYDSAATKGYYFLSNIEDLIILDKYGNTVYYKPGDQLSNFMLQANGIMTYNAFPKFFLMDSTFKVIDSITCKNVPITNYHELRILPDGHFLLSGTDSVKMNLSGYPYWKGRSGNDLATVKYTVIQEQDERKKVVFEWRANDHFAIEDADTFFLSKSAGFFDWTHADAVEVDRDGNILLSNRNFNEITKINRADGSIMWRLGGKHNQFKFINCPVPFYGQHDIRRIANGHITLFDNGDHTISHGARALEFELDEKKKIATLKWSYTNDSTRMSTRQGNVQRLRNSNTLINYGNVTGNTNNHLSTVVVTAAGTKIFELDDVNSYRVYNYEVLPWQLHRPQISCFDSLGVYYLDAGAAYKSYKWNTGDSGRCIPITRIGSYNVFVPYGESGYICSENFVVKDLSHPCDALKGK